MSYLDKLKQLEQAKSEPLPVDPAEGKIIAVLIDSTVLGAEIWFALDEGFQADPGDRRAVFYAAELPALRTKSPNQLRAIHAVKVAFGGGKVRQ